MSAERVSLLAFAVVGLAIAYLVLIGHLVATHPVLLGVQIAAVALMAWARLTFGMRSFHASAGPSEGGLVEHGPYRYWRHPIYASILYFVWAGQVGEPSLRALTAAILVTVGLVARMRLEERLLLAEYDTYRQYMTRTKRLIPFVL